MTVLETPQALATLAVILLAARLLGHLMTRIGQSPVLGELLAGLLLSLPGIGWLDPGDQTMRLFAEIGAVFLFLRLGLETGLRPLLPVLGAALFLAIVAVALPFALGYAVCWWQQIEGPQAIFVGITLGATGIGVTARVLEDIGRLQDVEGRMALAAAVVGNTICLVALAVTTHAAQGDTVTLLSVAKPAGMAVAFFVGVLVVGGFAVPALVRVVCGPLGPEGFTVLAVALACGLAWLATVCGVMYFIGAFLAGLVLRQADHEHEVELRVATLSHFFVPIFFAWVGAALDVAVLNPLAGHGSSALVLAGWLTVAAAAGKLLAPFLVRGFRGTGNDRLIGAALLPGAGVAAAFAQTGFSTGVLTAVTFNALTVVACLSAIAAPVLVRYLSRTGV